MAVWFGDRQTNSDGQVGVARALGAVRWEAAARDPDWHLGMEGQTDTRASRPTIISASLDLDHKTDQLFQRGRASS